MLKTKKELDEIYKKLSKIFGDKPVEEIKSHILSLQRKLEDITKSRENAINKLKILKERLKSNL